MANTVCIVHGAWRRPACSVRAATIRFSRTVRLLKTRRPCGTSATPRAAISSGGSRGTAARRQQPDADIHAGRFAGAVAPKEPEQAAFAQFERHLLQHMAVAVIGV